jgi:hypothetical protein
LLPLLDPFRDDTHPNLGFFLMPFVSQQGSVSPRCIEAQNASPVSHHPETWTYYTQRLLHRSYRKKKKPFDGHRQLRQTTNRTLSSSARGAYKQQKKGKERFAARESYDAKKLGENLASCYVKRPLITRFLRTGT